MYTKQPPRFSLLRVPSFVVSLNFAMMNENFALIIDGEFEAVAQYPSTICFYAFELIHK